MTDLDPDRTDAEHAAHTPRRSMRIDDRWDVLIARAPHYGTRASAVVNDAIAAWLRDHPQPPSEQRQPT